MPNREPTAPSLSIVVPIYNEEDNVEPLVRRLITVTRHLASTSEILLVDDGSRDGSAQRVSQLSALHPELRLIRLSRNFGHQAALVAGMEAARGDAVVTLDGDLQHPPELIPTLVEHWRNGADVVQTI